MNSNLTRKNSFVIGDVHGCYYTLTALLNELPPDANIILTGDLCDRGIFTCELIQLVKERGYLVVRGNHDEYMSTHLKLCLENDQYRPDWIIDPSFHGETTVESYRKNPAFVEPHINLVATFPAWIMVESVFITHGFGLPYYARRSTEKAQYSMVRNRISSEKEWGFDWEPNWRDYDLFNVFGHMVFDEPDRGKNWIGIDTGCGFGRSLTALSLETMETIAVPVDPRDFGIATLSVHESAPAESF